MDTETLPVGKTGVLAMPDVCSGCGKRLSFEEEKVCVPGFWSLPPGAIECEGWTMGTVIADDHPTRVYHPRCAPPV